ncbi:IucA/IucC family protein [Larsenimonas rhizosphaerae]|uniref:AcsA protein n=1 Tax=Larsenimonas rhizosphaerae TaxID=2944682 RepID=A0AA41ZHP3_9GAMM|nr:IucA/IucC family protein [Larsenimonas rhizosphaerae]MCX2524770.1 AcsA protein [Larsenimonas rhizosphaerae]
MTAFSTYDAPTTDDLHAEAARRHVLRSLVDALLVEEMFSHLPVIWSDADEASLWLAGHSAMSLLSADPARRLWRWTIATTPEVTLFMVLQPGITQAWELADGSGVWCVPAHGAVSVEGASLAPDEFMRQVCVGLHPDDPDPTAGEAVFLNALATSTWQLARSQAHCIDHQGLLDKPAWAFFTVMEQWASLLDRPYHPTAKAKEGLSAEEYVAWVAEFDQPVTLAWVAVRRSALMTGAEVAAGDAPATWLMTAAEQVALAAELHRLGVEESHMALPVHPWQQRHALPHWLAEAFACGDCLTLAVTSTDWKASSSLRSLLPGRDSRHSVKLPMAVNSLGASRYLPAVKMMNGDLSASLLHQAQARDARLAEALHLCEEGRWWAFMPEGASLFDEAPRHLSAMVRSYPEALARDPACRLLPMAALGTPLPEGGHHFLDDWLAWRRLEPCKENVVQLTGELIGVFFELTLRLFRLGMLPEVHGQNAVLVWREGRVTGMVLRDHDSLRIAVPALEAAGLADPEYRIKPRHSNTLYHDDLAGLLFWLQTLAIQVNVRAVVDTIASHFEMPVSALWQEVARQLRRQIHDIPFTAPVRALLIKQLFDAPYWPFKHLVGPIMVRAGGPGSMPFGTGRAVNPLQRIA